MGMFGSAFGSPATGMATGMATGIAGGIMGRPSRFQNYGAPRVSKFAGKYSYQAPGASGPTPSPMGGQVGAMGMGQGSVTNQASMGGGVLQGGSGMNGTANMPSGIQTLTGKYDMGNPTASNMPVNMINSPITQLDPNAASAFKGLLEDRMRNYRGPTGLGGQGEWVNGRWTGPQ